MNTTPQARRFPRPLFRPFALMHGAGWGMLGAIVILTIAGCSTPAGNSSARRFIQEGKYDQAVTEMRKAVAQRPHDSNLKLALAEAESLAADQHVTRAEGLIDQHRPGEALAELRIALGLMPAHPKAIVKLPGVEEQAKAARKLFEQSRAAVDSGQITEAVSLADRALAIDQGLEGARRVRDEINLAAVHEHREQARAALESQDWAVCEQAIAAIRVADPANQEASVLEKQLQDRRAATTLLDTAEQQQRQGQPLAALATLQQAASLWPENARLQAERDDLAALCVDQAASRSQTEAAAGRFDAALQALDALLPLVPEEKDMTVQHTRIACEWARHLMAAFERHALGDQWAEAWIVAVQAGAVCAQQLDEIAPHLERAERMLTRPGSPQESTIGDLDRRVNRLFELNARGETQQAITGLDDIFASRATGARLAACKRLASDRLVLQSQRYQADEVAGRKSTSSAPAETSLAARPAGSTVARPPASSPARGSVDDRPATTGTRRDRPSVTPPRSPQKPRTAPPRGISDTREPPRAFKGILSRDDKRFPKQLATVDGIVVKLKDTDGDPLDADVEILVGKRSTKHNDLRVGQSLIGRGQSGQRYQLIILRIIDDTETIEFLIQPMEEGTP